MLQHENGLKFLEGVHHMAGAGRGLRNTTINLNWNVNGQPLHDANRLVDEAIRASRDLDRRNEAAGRQIERTSRQYRNASNNIRENTDSMQQNASASRRAGESQNNLSRRVQNTTDRINENRRSMENASKSAKEFAEKADKIGEKLSNLGSKMMTGVTAPIMAAGVASVKYASDLNESINKVEVAFGSSAKTVENWSKGTLKNIGLAQGTALDLAATFGDMSTSMGFSTKKASEMSTKMVNLAGDLASFKNISIDQAYTALNGVFTGETEALKSLGVVMTQTNLQQFAYSRGIKTKIQNMSQAEQVELRYQYVMEKTKNAHGDFARTASGTANSMRVFTESTKELASSIGQKLLPVVTPMIQKATDLVNAFGQLSDEKQQKVIKWAAIAAAVGPAIFAFGKVASAIGAITKAMSFARRMMPGYRREMAQTAGQAVASAAEMQAASASMDGDGPVVVGSRMGRRQRSGSRRGIFSRIFRRGSGVAADAGQEASTVAEAASTASNTASRMGRFTSIGSKFLKGAGYLSVGLSAIDLIKSTKDEVVGNLGGAAGSGAGMAIGSTIGSLIAPGIGTAIGGAVGSWAGTYLGSTIGKAIQKNHPGIVKKVSSAIGSVKDIFSDPLDTSIKSGNGLSKSTAAAYNEYKKLSDKAIEQIKYFDWNGKSISRKTAESLSGTYTTMGDTIVNGLKSKFGKSEDTIKTFLSHTKGLSAKEQSQIMKDMDKSHNSQIDKVRMYQNKIKKILNTASKEHRSLTQKDQNEIEKYQNKMNRYAVQSMSKSAKEQKIILGQLSDNTEKLSAKQASAIVKHSKRAKDSAIKDANDKYKKVMKAANEEYFVNHSISKEQYETIKKNAEKTRDDSVKAATEMHNQVVKKAKQQAAGHIAQVDWETGESLSKWDNFVVGLARKVNAVSSGINKVLDFFHFSSKIPMWKPAGYASAQNNKSTKTTTTTARPIAAYASGTRYHSGGHALVGEEGPELAYIPYSGKATLLGANGPEVMNIPQGTSILPASQTKSLLKGGLGAGKTLPGYASGVGDFFKTAFNWVMHPIEQTKKLFAQHMNFGKNDIGPGKGLGVGIMEFIRDKAGPWLKENLLSFSGAGTNGAAAPAQVKKWLLTAMAITGTPASYLGALTRVAMHESSGNPRSINLWDSNAKAGHPSKGLMQTIDSTFNKYKLPGMDDIWNPIHNAVAAIRYMNARYGSISNVPGVRSAKYVGYKKGGRPPINEAVLVGEEGPELFETDTHGTIHNAQKTRQLLNSKGGPVLQFHAPLVSITIQGNASESAANTIAQEVKKQVMEIFRQLGWHYDLGEVY